MAGENGWPEYQRMVLQRLDDTAESLAHIEEQVTALRIDVAILKTKAALFGAGAGAVVAIIFRMLAGG